MQSSSKVNIRKITPTDSILIAQWKDDPLMREMSVGLDTTITVENQKTDIEKAISNDLPYYIIESKATQKPIGYIRVDWMDDDCKFAWLRFGLGEHRGKGYCKEALKIFLDMLFDSGVYRVDAEVYEINKPSFHILTSLGFKHEGTKRDALYQNDMFNDIFVMGMVRTDRS